MLITHVRYGGQLQQIAIDDTDNNNDENQQQHQQQQQQQNVDVEDDIEVELLRLKTPDISPSAVSNKSPDKSPATPAAPATAVSPAKSTGKDMSRTLLGSEILNLPKIYKLFGHRLNFWEKVWKFGENSVTDIFSNTREIIKL